MKRIVLLLISFVFMAGLKAQTPLRIIYKPGTWADIQAQAKKSNAIIFVDAYATWCGPCKWMAQNVFNDSTVANYYNSHFLCYQLDQEKGEGPDFAKQYQVSAYPTFLFIDGNGQMIHKVVGEMEVKAFLQAGKIALDPTANLLALKTRYQNGDRSRDFLYDFSKAEMMAYEADFPKYSNEYFKSIPGDLLISESTWDAIKLFGPDVNSFMFTYVLNHRDKYAQLFTVEAVNEYIDESALQSLQQAVHAKDSLMLGKAKNLILQNGSYDAQKLMAMSELKFYLKNNSLAHFTSLARVYTEKYFMSDPLSLNEVAADYASRITTPEDLAQAESWAKHSVDLDDSYYNNATYALLLNKNGKKDQALNVAKHAIELGKTNGENTADMDDLVTHLSSK